MKKQLSILLTTLIMIMSIFNVNIINSYAILTDNDMVNDYINNKNYSYLGKKSDIPLDKVFEINFSKDVDFDTTKSNIELYRENSIVKTEIDISKTNSLKTIKVNASNGLIDDSKYYLVIKDGIKNLDGNSLVFGGVLEFDTQELKDTGFNVTNANFVSKNELQIDFNKDLDTSTSMVVNNYNIYDIKKASLAINNIKMKDSNSVLITFNTDLPIDKLRTLFVTVSKNVMSSTQDTMEYSYIKEVRVNNSNLDAGEFLLLGSQNYDRKELKYNLDIFGNNARVKNANIHGDLYIKGSYVDIENVDVSGTIYIDVDQSFVYLRNVTADNIKVYSASSIDGVRLYGVETDYIDVETLKPVEIALKTHMYPTNIYRTNLTLNNNVKLTNDTTDPDISFGRIEVNNSSQEGKDLYLEGRVLKEKEYLEVFAGCNIYANTPSTSINKTVLKPKFKGTVKLKGTNKTTNHFNEVYVEEQGELIVLDTLVSKIIMKEDNINLESVYGEIGTLVTNNNTVLMNQITEQNIGNILVKDPDDPEDITPPEVKALEQSVYTVLNNDGFATVAKVQSNELSGHVYIVKTGELQDTYKEIEALLEVNKAARTIVTEMDTYMEISALGLEPGTYYAYAIDAAKNMSTRGENAIEVIGLEKTKEVTLDKIPRQGDQEISGKTEAGAEVSVQGGTMTTPRTTNAGPDGSFTIGVSIKEGNVLTFTARAQNKLTSEVTTVTVLPSFDTGNLIESFNILKQDNTTQLGNYYNNELNISDIDYSQEPAKIIIDMPQSITDKNLVARMKISEGAKAYLVEQDKEVFPEVLDRISFADNFKINVLSEKDIENNLSGRQYDIIINKLSNELGIEPNGSDFKIDSNSIKAGNQDTIDSNDTVDEFNSKIKYIQGAENSQHVIVDTTVLQNPSSITNKLLFDAITASQKLEGTEKLKSGAKLILMSEDGMQINIFDIDVDAPTLQIKLKDPVIQQAGNKAVEGTKQITYYDVESSDINKGRVKLKGPSGEFVEFDITKKDIVATASEIKAELDENKDKLGLKDFDITPIGNKLRFEYIGDKAIDNIDKLIEIEELDSNSYSASIDIEQIGGAKEIANYRLGYSIAAGSPSQTIEIRDKNTQVVVASYKHSGTEGVDKTQLAQKLEEGLEKTSGWEDIVLQSNQMIFKSAVYGLNRDLEMTVSDVVYEDGFKVIDKNDFGRDKMGENYSFEIKLNGFSIPMTYEFEALKHDSGFSTTTSEFEMYSNLGGIITDIKEKLDTDLWDVKGSDSGFELTANKHIEQIVVEDLLKLSKVKETNVELNKNSEGSKEGVAYTDAKQLKAVVDFDIDNIQEKNTINLEIKGISNEDTKKEYKVSIQAIEIPASSETSKDKRKEDIIDILAKESYWTDKPFKVKKDTNNPYVITIEGDIDPAVDIDNITVTISAE